MARHIAYADRAGVIGFGVEPAPAGRLPFAFVNADQADRLRELVEARARLAHDNKTLLVPGIPEAEDDEWKALEALIDFELMITKGMAQ